MTITIADLSRYLAKSSERWDRLCQAVAATAWAEGYIAGMNDQAEGREPDETPNPYEKEEEGS